MKIPYYLKTTLFVVALMFIHEVVLAQCGTFYSVSKSGEGGQHKYGKEEFPGYESSPPKIYLTERKVENKTSTFVGWYPPGQFWVDESSSTITWTYRWDPYTGNYTEDCDALEDSIGAYMYAMEIIVGVLPKDETSTCSSTYASSSSTMRDGYGVAKGDSEITLSDEHTDDMMIGNMKNRVDKDFNKNDWATNCVYAVPRIGTADYEIDADHLFCSGSKFEYFFLIKNTAKDVTYKVSWVKETTYPDGSKSWDAMSEEVKGTGNDVTTKSYTEEVPGTVCTIIVTDMSFEIVDDGGGGDGSDGSPGSGGPK